MDSDRIRKILLRENVEMGYYTPFEVVIHNKPDDCWVTLCGKVLNITSLIQENKGKKFVRPLMALAGKDISHWFDCKTGDVQTRIHPVTGVKVPYCPHGPLPHIPPEVPCEWWKDTLPKGFKWWKDPQYLVGYLTRKVRPIRIINMLTCKEATLNVCDEDTIRTIMDRYSIFNSDVENYLWRFMDKDVDLDKTLEENGIEDERDKFAELGMATNYYVPCLFLYYKDSFKDFDVTDSSDDEGSKFDDWF